jgi:hypothetical protein
MQNEAGAPAAATQLPEHAPVRPHDLGLHGGRGRRAASGGASASDGVPTSGRLPARHSQGRPRTPNPALPSGPAHPRPDVGHGQAAEGGVALLPSLVHLERHHCRGGGTGARGHRDRPQRRPPLPPWQPTAAGCAGPIAASARARAPRHSRRQQPSTTMGRNSCTHSAMDFCSTSASRPALCSSHTSDAANTCGWVGGAGGGSRRRGGCACMAA